MALETLEVIIFISIITRLTREPRANTVAPEVSK